MYKAHPRKYINAIIITFRPDKKLWVRDWAHPEQIRSDRNCHYHRDLNTRSSGMGQ